MKTSSYTPLAVLTVLLSAVVGAAATGSHGEKANAGQSQAAGPPGSARQSAEAQGPPASAKAQAPAKTPAAPHDSRDAACECSPCERDATALLADLLDVPGRHEGGGDLGPAVARAAREHVFTLEYLLATVPDPVESNFGFDLYLSAIDSALGRSGYLMDRFWLPFRSGSDGTRGQQEQPDGCRQRHPGVLIYRHAPADSWPTQSGKRLLAIYLIGESPTAGIHQGAFARALSDAAGFLPPGQAQQDPVRVIGPTFSGSAPSLRLAIDRHDEYKFTVLSGSATNRGNQDILTVPQRACFRATVLPDDVVQQAMYHYLVDKFGAHVQDGELPEVAILSEDTTAYGQGLLDPRHGDGLRPRLLLPYPIHISRLRGAWHKDGMAKPTPTPDDNPRLTLPRLLADPERADIPPLQSQATVSRDDLSLMNIMTTLSKERIHYVGLFTLDSEDRLFLAQQLHKFCPDVRIFTLESDIIDTHPEAADLHGMLVASTYPLFTRNQLWTAPHQGDHRRLQFPTNGAHGVYNATLALLGNTAELLEYGHPAEGPSPAASAASPVEGPPVWISAVGNGTLVPLSVQEPDPLAGPGGLRGYLYRQNDREARSAAVIDREARSADCPLQRPGPPPGESPQGPPPAHSHEAWLHYQLGALDFASLAAGLFAFLLCACFFYVCFSPERAKRYPFRVLIAFRPGAVVQRFYLLLVFLSLACPAGTLAYLEWQGPVEELWGRLNIMLSLGLGCAILAAAILLTLLYDARQKKLAAAGGALLCGLWLVLLWHFLGPAPAGPDHSVERIEHLFFLTRIGNPAFGLSPAVPVLCLCAAVFFWAYYNVKRIWLLDEAKNVPIDDTLCPPTARGATGNDGQQALGDLIHAAGDNIARDRVFTVLLCGVLLWSILARLMTLEGRRFDLFSAAFFLLVYAAVMGSHLRFLKLWYHFQRFLRHLAALPMVDAYDRLPPQFSRTVGIQLLERIPLGTELEALWRHFCLLANHFALFEQANLADGQPAGSELRKSIGIGPDLHHRWSDLVTRSATYNQLAEADRRSFFSDVSAVLTDILELFWDKRPLPAALSSKPPVKDDASLHTTNTAALYLRFLPDDVHLWLRLAEDFIAIQVVAYLSHIFPLLRGLLIFVVVGMLLLLAAVMLYPFQPQHLLLSLNWVLILSVVALTLVVFVQMNRNEVLSRIAKSEPGKVTWDRLFISPLLIYVVLPVLSLVASQLPELRGFLFSWVEPFLRALK